jgi:hypothetical protein
MTVLTIRGAWQQWQRSTFARASLGRSLRVKIRLNRAL